MQNVRSPWLTLAMLMVGCLFAWRAEAAAQGDGGEGGATPDVKTETSPVPLMTTRRSPESAEVARGTPVTIEGRNFGHDSRLISLTLGGLEIGHPIVAKDTWLTFAVPNTIGKDKDLRPFPLGEALLRISVKSPLQVEQLAADPLAAGRLHVVADSSEPPKLTGVSPRVGTARDLLKLTLIGSGFPELGRDLSLLVDDVEVPLCFDESKCRAWAQISGHQLVLQGKPDPEHAGMTTLSQLLGVGKHRVALRFGEGEPIEAIELTISGHDAADIRLRALMVGAAILGALVLVVVWGGTYKVGRTEYVIRAFLIDTETESYSLGKLQFFLWSVAALLGYAYLLLSRFMVQGRFELPDVPDGLPGILAISAGTTVGSIGVTKLKGPKGSGTAEPSFSDLVSIGGVVSPERFQFLLWTIVAVGAFLGAALQLDPLQIDTLPQVPPTLLALSGISSAGYLGGKLVRAPGPVITEVMVGSGSLVLTLIGRNLDRFARFEINGKSLSSLLEGKRDDGSPYRAVVLEPETGKDDLAKSMRIVLEKPHPDWVKSSKQPPPLELTIINQDGQRAAYTLDVSADVWRAFVGSPPPAPPESREPPVPGTPPTDNTIHDSSEPDAKEPR